MRRTLGIAFVAVIALGLTACSSDSSSSMNDSSSDAKSSNATKVDIKTFQFRPTELRVNAGTTVTWTNRDDIEHTVTSDESGAGAAFDGPVDGIDAKFSYKFASAGTFSYHCSIHPGMNARVVVSR